MSFSENGYFLATSAEDGVKVWDLRKLKAVKSFEVGAGGGSALPIGVRFDLSSLFLAMGGDGAQVAGSKQDWGELANLAPTLGNKVRASPAPQKHAQTYELKGG